MNSTGELTALSVIGFIFICIVVVVNFYGLAFVAALVRDLCGMTPNTPDLSSLGANHQNVRLWLRRMKGDGRDAAQTVGRATRSTLWFVLGLVALALIIWGVVSMWGALSGAPAWALIMFFVLLVAFLSRR